MYETTKSQFWMVVPLWRQLPQKSVRKRVTSVMRVDWATSFGRLKVCETVKLLVSFLHCNGGKLEEAEDFKCGFVHYCLFKFKLISWSGGLFSYIWAVALENWCSRFQTRSDTNRAVQPLKMARGLKLWI